MSWSRLFLYPWPAAGHGVTMDPVVGRGSGGDQRGSVMSVLITIKVTGDTVAFRRAVTERATEFAKIGESARAVGAIHHRFGIGDGYVLIVDEWESTQQFENFFSNPDLQAFIGEIGGDTSVAPEIAASEAIESSDQF